MFVIMDSRASDEDIARVENRIKELGYQAHTIHGDIRRAIGVTGNRGTEDRIYLEGLPGVQQVIPVTKPYKLASRE
ncbi:MAG: 3-deoxy-7-phosphoheptulonate synthase, partial [Calditrichaeota bacterium]|nr:3-deoxy-7-phosphoheptulonate synthase [Calditrichota bacterium]